MPAANGGGATFMQGTMKYKPNEIISVKIAMDLIGYSHSGAHQKIKKARQALGKEPQHLMTVGEFCHYYGIRLE